MRTSAAPLALPIYQSFDGSKGGPVFLDGGVIANNPSMITLAKIVGWLVRGSDGPAPQSTFQTFANTWLLSVGTGRNMVGEAQFLTPEFANGLAAWGYQKWLFDLSNPFVLVDVFYEGDNESAAFKSRILLGDDKFNRLNVPIKEHLVQDDPRTQKAGAETAAWLRKHDGWMKPGSDLEAALRSAPRRSGV
jgi:patatin-like phospholipase/acyl hydrolase